MVRYHFVNRNCDQQAVVLGADLAGLLMARILLDHFHRVTVISNQRLLREPTPPATLQQALPMHVLAVQGQRQLERLFPGLTAELIIAGAPNISWTADAPLLLPNGWGPRFHSDLISRSTTYNLLRHRVYQRLADYSRGRLTFLEQRQICDIQPNHTRPRVIIRSPASGTQTTLTPDLIVDTSAQPTAWRCQAETTTISSSKGLTAVQVFQRPLGLDLGWRALLLLPHQDQPGGAIIPVEGQQWLVMLSDLKVLPKNDAEFMYLASKVRSPILAEALRGVDSLSPIFGSTDTTSQLWHFHQVPTWPDRLIDTQAVHLNPILGLDLTLATMSALTLREALDDQRKRYPDGNLTGLGPRFQKRLARTLAFPWQFLKFQENTGMNRKTRWLQWYGKQVFEAARHDPAILEKLLAVVGLATPPHQLFSPHMMRQVSQQLRNSRQYIAAPNPPPLPEKRQTITQEMAALAISRDR